MEVVIRLTAEQHRRALPILLRHSPGIMLPGRTYIVEREAASALRSAGVEFDVVARVSTAPGEGLASRKRI